MLGPTAEEIPSGLAWKTVSPQAERSVRGESQKPKQRMRTKKLGARGKSQTLWVKALWVGRHDRSDDSIALTPQGPTRARTIRRMCETDRWDTELFDAVTGKQWDDTVDAKTLTGMAIDTAAPTLAPVGEAVEPEPAVAPEAAASSSTEDEEETQKKKSKWAKAREKKKKEKEAAAAAAKSQRD